MGTLGAQAGLEEGRGQMDAQGQSSKKGARWPAVQPDLCQRRLPCQATEACLGSSGPAVLPPEETCRVTWPVPQGRKLRPQLEAGAGARVLPPPCNSA